MKLFKMLVVEDDSQLREAIVDTLQLEGIKTLEANSAESAIELLKNQSVDMVLSDISMGALSGFDLLNHVKSQYPTTPMVLMTAFGEVEKAVQAIQQGAMDYLVKPFEVNVLVETVNQFRNQNGDAGSSNDPVAQDPSSKALLKLAKQVADSEATVLISGESGTGKEVLARYIHQNSPRKSGPFIAINCAAIPENMLESTLFGYEKGAFTGAYNSMPGKFEQAQGGTLLLDEISEMEIGLQAKILRVLQEREVERLGGRKTIPLDVRILATTNRNLLEYVSEKKFREDLYYRLSVFPLQWKSLRQRPQDLLPIAERLLTKHCKKQNKPTLIFDESAQYKLQQHNWPGNVRELDNVIQRALIIQTGHSITASDIVLNMEPMSNTHVPSHFSGLDMEVPSESLVESVPQDALGDNLKQTEYTLILDALKHEKNKKRAAEKLGISPRTLRYKMAKMREQGIDIQRQLLT
ncbi:sigma-54-dependent response regulator transcription factor FleR [Oceaniserpentilla sp. 4NH20-0058]|uniref:sigma-54-dependent transcriptional regulator n=1 Tax=Oceaniserpentilla sp. 4NH20-0058 TaxID=3127660 RepID=UPI003105BBE0